MIERIRVRTRIQDAIERSRVSLLIGARQVGKTTLARTFVDESSLNYFDLENPADLARLEQPMTALADLSGVIVIDEIQRRPDLFPVLRVLSDRHPLPARFLILGSAAPDALRQATESLTGRLEELAVSGFSLAEIGIKHADRLWLRGGYPLAYLAKSDADSFRWRRQYARSLASQDLRDFGLRLSPLTIERFLAVVATAHGQLWNAAAPARALGISETTSRHYLDVLSDALLVRVLQPWSNNLGKRLRKRPKVYFRDSGLLHALLGVESKQSLLRHALVGSSWEGFVIEEVLKLAGDRARPYYWRTSNGAEVDLLLEFQSTLIAIEVKRSDAPSVTRSMRTAITELGIDRLIVIYPGKKRYKMGERIEAVPLGEIEAAILEALESP